MRPLARQAGGERVRGTDGDSPAVAFWLDFRRRYLYSEGRHLHSGETQTPPGSTAPY